MTSGAYLVASPKRAPSLHLESSAACSARASQVTLSDAMSQRRYLGKTIAVGEVRGCLVLALLEQSPSDDEIRESFEAANAPYFKHSVRPRVLWVTQGGLPTPTQRSWLVNAMAPFDTTIVKSAVVTSSTFARGVAAGYSQMRPIYRLFNADELDAALEFLGIPLSDCAAVKAFADELSSALRGSAT